MKTGILFAALLVTSLTWAQKKDVTDETVIKKTVIKSENDQQEMVEKINVKQEQDIQMKEADAEKVDQSQEQTPVKVTTTKTMEGDDSVMVTENETLYKYDGKEFSFTSNTMGFTIGEKGSSATIHVYKSDRKNTYIIEAGGASGIGYFDTDNNFVIEYLGTDKKTLIKKTYELSKED